MNTIAQNQIEIISQVRTGVRQERIEVLINGFQYFGCIIKLGENWNKKYVQFLRKPNNKNRAKYSLYEDLENYLNTL